jgi:hypothetical protein
MVYCHMIYSPETKQNKAVIFERGVTKHYYYLHTNGIIHSDFVLCARWVPFVTADSSSSLPVCSMRVLPPSSAADQLLILFPSGGPGPPPFPPLRLTPFPSGSRHLPASSSATVTVSCHTAKLQHKRTIFLYCLTLFTFSLKKKTVFITLLYRECVACTACIRSTTTQLIN